MDFGELPCHMKKFMEFLVVDTCSAFHGILRRTALKDLQVVTSIHHLAMKFPTLVGVAKVHGNQTKERAWLVNDLRKVTKCEDVPSTVMTMQTELMDIDPKKVEEKMVLNEV
ncbi:Uncharacterized protein Adt_03438 [Abeliophyllum distichum]|uniref:Uncharacterized protein n=1 Tax=Abeliophyllum distichum TaxID=126358 RepID=A0ABD1VYH1_9LAMI